MAASTQTRDRVIQLLLDHKDPNAEVDCGKMVEALGYSSLQQMAFLKAVNSEFGTNITPEDLQAARGKGGLMSLLP